MGSPIGRRPLTYRELDRLEGELLPPRAAMSAVALTPHAGLPAHAAGGSEGDVQVFYACTSTYNSGTPGLLGTGLLATEASQSVSCVPAVVHER